MKAALEGVLTQVRGRAGVRSMLQHTHWLFHCTQGDANPQVPHLRCNTRT